MDVSPHRTGMVAAHAQVTRGCTRRSSQPSACWKRVGRDESEVVVPQGRDERPAPRAGGASTSASTKTSTEPVAWAASRAHAQGLPSQPGGGGSSPPRMSTSRGSAAARASTRLAVPSVEPSSRTSTVRSGTPVCARAERTVVAMCAASSRAGISTRHRLRRPRAHRATGDRSSRRLTAVWTRDGPGGRRAQRDQPAAQSRHDHWGWLHSRHRYGTTTAPMQTPPQSATPGRSEEHEVREHVGGEHPGEHRRRDDVGRGLPGEQVEQPHEDDRRRAASRGSSAGGCPGCPAAPTRSSVHVQKPWPTICGSRNRSHDASTQPPMSAVPMTVAERRCAARRHG